MIGTYSFDNVLIDDNNTNILNQYYVEFEYDGLKYQNVAYAGGGDGSYQSGTSYYVANTSKAQENASNRIEEFNAGFRNVKAKEGTYGNVGTVDDNGLEIGYNRSENHKSTLLGYKPTPTIYASTKESGWNMKAYYDYLIQTNNKVPEELTNINLGLYEREQPDYALVNDIQSVKVKANDYEHIYNYDNRWEENGKYDTRFGVSYEDKYSENVYENPIYKADIQNHIKNQKEFEVYITYKITARNDSTNLLANINNITDYYDNRFEFVSVGEGYASQGENVGNIENTINLPSDLNRKQLINDSYSKITIPLNKTDNFNNIGAGETRTIYIQFKLNNDGKSAILSNDQNLYRNITEIGSYSTSKWQDLDGEYNINKETNQKTWDEELALYAGIDKDSAPENVIVGNKDTYEDDTDWAPTLKLVPKEERTLTGAVFLDYTDPELKTGDYRMGDGKYADKDTPISGVTVTLKNENGDNVDLFTNDGNLSSNTATTDSNGTFTFKGLPAGKYKVEYTWGGQKIGNTEISVQNYKATIYNDKERQNNDLWYTMTDPRYSDAFDDMNTREKIDEEIKTRTYSKGDISTTTQKNMISTTPKMSLGIEYGDNTTGNATNVVDKNNDGSITGDDLTYNYDINNIDFGIVERPRQSTELTKRVKNLKLTLDDGSVISNVEIDSKGNLTGEKSNVTNMRPQSQSNKGFVKVELDNELIQGATLEVTYEFAFKNNSEKDYMYTTDDNDAGNKFYKYGEKLLYNAENSKLVKIVPDTIIDYLDLDWGYEAERNPKWKAITSEELKKQYLENPESKLLDSKVFDTNSDTNTTSEINNRIILVTENMGIEPKESSQILPGRTSTVDLTVSQILTSTDEISFDNETEIIKLTHEGGGSVINTSYTPGNYIPGTTPKEPDEAWAELVTVTPSTGKNLNIILPITIGVISLVMLGTGVILIKKKIL